MCPQVHSPWGGSVSPGAFSTGWPCLPGGACLPGGESWFVYMCMWNYSFMFKAQMYRQYTNRNGVCFWYYNVTVVDTNLVRAGVGGGYRERQRRLDRGGRSKPEFEGQAGDYQVDTGGRAWRTRGSPRPSSVRKGHRRGSAGESGPSVTLEKPLRYVKSGCDQDSAQGCEGLRQQSRDRPAGPESDRLAPGVGRRQRRFLVCPGWVGQGPAMIPARMPMGQMESLNHAGHIC